MICLHQKHYGSKALKRVCKILLVLSSVTFLPSTLGVFFKRYLLRKNSSCVDETDPEECRFCCSHQSLDFLTKSFCDKFSVSSRYSTYIASIFRSLLLSMKTLIRVFQSLLKILTETNPNLFQASEA